MVDVICKNCKTEIEVTCPSCGLVLCPHCGTVNKLEGDQGEGENWLACPEFEGEEAIIPTGLQIRSPNIFVLDLVAALEVLDRGQISIVNPWTDTSGMSGKILSVIINEAAVQKLQNSYNGRGIVVSDVSGNRLTVPEWRAKYHTDPLALLAITRAYLATVGPGVQTYRSTGTKYGLTAKQIAGSGQLRVNLGSGIEPIKLGKVVKR